MADRRMLDVGCLGLTEDERNKLSRKVREVLRRAKARAEGPLTLEEIARRVAAPTAETYEAISIDLHGFYEMRDSKFRWL